MMSKIKLGTELLTMPILQVGEMVRGLFAPRYFHFSKQKFPLGTLAHKNESSHWELFPGSFVPWSECSLNIRFVERYTREQTVRVTTNYT